MRTYSAASWGSWERKACAAASPAAPAPTRSAAACAPSAALRRRPVMEGGPCPLFVSAGVSGQVVLAEAVSSALAHPGQVLVRGLGGSAEAFLWNRPQRRVLQRLRVGVLAGLDEIVQVEVARDERGGLAVRLVQGQRLVPLPTCSKRGRWLKPWARRVFIYCCATSPAARSTPLRSARA